MQVSDIKARIFVRYQGVAILQNLIITIEISEKIRNCCDATHSILDSQDNDSHARARTAADAFWVRHAAAADLKMFRTGSGCSGCMTFNLLKCVKCNIILIVKTAEN